MSDGTTNSATAARPARQWPDVNALSTNDVIEALAHGLHDFRAAPAYGLFFGGIYALGGIALVLMLRFLDLPYLVYPLATGFALIAPFVATGLYDVSRKLERGEPLSWGSVLASVKTSSGRDLGWMALVTVFTLIIWMDIAALLFFAFFGMGAKAASGTGATLVREILTTPEGWTFLAIGNLVGAVIAFGVYSFSVTSFPMLFDRDVDFVTAMVTSIRVVMKSPRTMLLWAAIIAGLLGISLLSGFLGLFVTLPVLGHATWHIYRKAVAPQPAAS